jgi:hypothetical protein
MVFLLLLKLPCYSLILISFVLAGPGRQINRAGSNAEGHRRGSWSVNDIFHETAPSVLIESIARKPVHTCNYCRSSSCDAEAYDKLQNDLVTAKERLTKILQSKDKKTTVRPATERLKCCWLFSFGHVTPCMHLLIL